MRNGTHIIHNSYGFKDGKPVTDNIEYLTFDQFIATDRGVKVIGLDKHGIIHTVDADCCQVVNDEQGKALLG